MFTPAVFGFGVDLEIDVGCGGDWGVEPRRCVLTARGRRREVVVDGGDCR